MCPSVSHVHRMASEIQPAAAEAIRIRGARVHNLQNIDLDIPRDRFVVVTGPSGSGKSSLAFDTLYAEGQRQYIESLSTYARQFLHQLERPDVDLIEGLQPTISIDQRAGSHNPRSTVATVTEIYDYLRLLFARLGEPRCYQCGEPIRQQTPEQILDALLELSAGTRVMILAPLVRGRKGEHKDVFDEIRKAGFLRARVDGQVVDVGDPPALVAQQMHNIEAVIDRVVVREGRARANRRVDQPGGPARRRSGLAAHEEKTKSGSLWHDRLFSTQYACPNCKISYEELEPRTFSFNSPYGACPACEGLGARVAFDPDLVLPDASLSLAAGADRAVEGRNARRRAKTPEPSPTVSRQGRHPLGRAAGETFAEAPRSNCCTARARGSSACWDCWKRNTPRRRTRRSGSGSRPFVARWPARSAAAPGCGPRPVRCSSPAGRFTKSRPCRSRPRGALFPRSAWEHTGLEAPRPLCSDTFESGELQRGRRASKRDVPTQSVGTDRKATDKNVSVLLSFFESQRPIAQPILERDRRAAGFPGPRGPGLSHAGPARRHLERRRIAARAVGGRAGLGTGRRLLRARRAFDRTPPPRQPAADRRPAASCSRAATRWWWSSTTRRSCAVPIGSWTLGPERAGTAAAWWPRARPNKSPPAAQSLTGRYLAGVEKIAVPEQPPPRGQDAGDHHRRRDHQ